MADWQQRHAAFLAAWPECCRACDATGLIFDQDLDDDFCDECIYAEKCPRCHADFVYHHGDSRCGACDWMVGEEQLPWVPECDCSEQLAEQLKGTR
jgi:hypothetical protein